MEINSSANVLISPIRALASIRSWCIRASFFSTVSTSLISMCGTTETGVGCFAFVHLRSVGDFSKRMSEGISGKKVLRIAHTSGQVKGTFPLIFLLSVLSQTPIPSAIAFFFMPRLAISLTKFGYTGGTTSPPNFHAWNFILEYHHKWKLSRRFWNISSFFGSFLLDIAKIGMYNYRKE